MRHSLRLSPILLLSVHAKKFDLGLTVDLPVHWKGTKVGAARETAAFSVVICFFRLWTKFDATRALKNDTKR